MVTLVVALAALHGGGVRAQNRDAVTSEALFQEGRRLMKARSFAAACTKFEESLRLDPAVGTMLNLADCFEQVGRTASAWQYWRAASDQLPTADKRRATALARAATLEKILSRLTIELRDGSPAGTRVVRDGTTLGAASLGLPLPVDPGRHEVVVSADGHETRKFEVAVGARQRESVTVEPGPKSTAATDRARAARGDEDAPVALEAGRPPERSVGPGSTPGVASGPVTAPDRDAAAGGGSRKLLSYALIGAGAAVAAAGVYFGLQARSARDDAARSCVNGTCWNTADDALSRDKQFSLLADVSMVAGLAAVGAGLYFLFTAPAAEGRVNATVSPRRDGGEVKFAVRF
jgi:hypothetical protein